MGVSIINHPFLGYHYFRKPAYKHSKISENWESSWNKRQLETCYHGETPVVGTKNISSGKTPAILCCLFCFCGGGGVGENMYNKQAKPAIKGLMGPWPLHFNFTHIGYCIIQHLWSSLLVQGLSYLCPFRDFRQLNEWTTTSWMISIKIKPRLLIHAKKSLSDSHISISST